MDDRYFLSKHPREMTAAELEAIPVVNRLFQRETGYTSDQGVKWDIGRSGDLWVKALRVPPAVIQRQARRPT